MGEDEACWSGAEEEDFEAGGGCGGWEGGFEFVEAVEGAGGGFDEGCFYVGEVVDFVDFA